MSTTTTPTSTTVLLVVVVVGQVVGHEYYPGRCPALPPVEELDWGRWRGEWRVALKHNTRSSCVRYEYSGGEEERRVEETKLLPVLPRFGVPAAVMSVGSLTQGAPSSGAFKVEWDTGVLREAMFSTMQYVVLATDYTSSALVCSCQQSLNLGFGEVNRRSCDFLMRGNGSTPSLPEEYKEILDQVDPDLAKDLRRVRQDSCDQLQGPVLHLGSWVARGREALGSGLAYITGLMG